MAIVQRIRYLDSLPARDREILLQAEMEVEQEDKDIKNEDDFHEILEDICAIDIAEDDYTEVLQFEYDENMKTTHWGSESFEIAMGGPGDLF
ncbi:hypothetical protein SpCBS45565_g00450 [Spizellomyces sp. 'palustris']|nr:hypothetical protein SpCBS45565_g00450 [Spizellomyces sp. 'palustris']